ncbi:acyl-CoA C20 Delta5-desaturase-like [Cynara cardunculus var. scolymus]|uniref:acyl-CoA C20 Delta5-desaturase-like n=1 Tax=Cynara cardunculus var. scolymus TaxID=59895 RepID=UPI000D62C8A4|nr:acyl-CoA C20 Delta5-desaturase-like [Cynara cardunculus var. scolymus]
MAPPESTPILELEKMRKRGFWFRKWDSADITNLCLIIVKHVLGCCAPFVFDWGAFWVTLVLGILAGLGVTLGYHRLLTHRSFKIPKWLEYFIVYCGVHGGQKDPIFWVSVHKNHHKYADTEKDPHTPMEGFWFSHMGWFCHNQYIAAKCGESRSGGYSNVAELKAQWFYRFLHDTYTWHTVALASLLYLHGGFPYLAWGMGMRELVINHFTFLVTSASHMWGQRPWNTPDTSTNNWWVAMLTLGEGWHNNHHAFPKSARHGLELWQFDLTWELIKFLHMVGLATDVKVATEADKKRMALR